MCPSARVRAHDQGISGRRFGFLSASVSPFFHSVFLDQFEFLFLSVGHSRNVSLPLKKMIFQTSGIDVLSVNGVAFTARIDQVKSVRHRPTSNSPLSQNQVSPKWVWRPTMPTFRAPHCSSLFCGIKTLRAPQSFLSTVTNQEPFLQTLNLRLSH